MEVKIKNTEYKIGIQKFTNTFAFIIHQRLSRKEFGVYNKRHIRHNLQKQGKKTGDKFKKSKGVLKQVNICSLWDATDFE